MEKVVYEIVNRIVNETRGKRVAVVWRGDVTSTILCHIAKEAGIRLAVAIKRDDVSFAREIMPRGTIIYHGDDFQNGVTNFYHHFSMDQLLSEEKIESVNTWNPIGHLTSDEMDQVKDYLFPKGGIIDDLESEKVIV